MCFHGKLQTKLNEKEILISKKEVEKTNWFEAEEKADQICGARIVVLPQWIIEYFFS